MKHTDFQHETLDAIKKKNNKIVNLTVYDHVVQGCSILAVAIFTFKDIWKYNAEHFKLTLPDKLLWFKGTNTQQPDQHHRTIFPMPLLQHSSLCWTWLLLNFYNCFVPFHYQKHKCQSQCNMQCFLVT